MATPFEQGLNRMLQDPSWGKSSYIIHAVNSDAIHLLKEALAFCGEYINDLTEGEGVTALYHAVFRGNKESVDLLLRAGADPNKTGRHRSTPFAMAVQFRNMDLVKTLLQHGANINSYQMPNAHSINYSPLGLAANNNDVDVMKLLVNAGARLTKVAVINVSSLIFCFLEQPGYTALFVDNVLKFLTEAGHNILDDHFLRQLAQKKRDSLSQLESQRLSDATLLIGMMEIYTEPEFSRKYRQFNRYPPGFLEANEVHLKALVVKKYLVESSQARSLAFLCRLRIRNRLSKLHQHRALSLVVPKLEVPVTLKEYIMMEDVRIEKELLIPDDS
ncbi:ankyrin repeat and SOCS box protein 1 isoform X2 [Aplysia californica]|uniref:Ankyrin repeat and SOCS box protein 1 isoform X2 n=1 Tax=Aplysia californica TaxID=6500 RepID=A0ABM0JHA3_APLCA|nr:ankyrin repeat and SOCS box protein 1 isoform X2 [Aplysia californica]